MPDAAGLVGIDCRSAWPNGDVPPRGGLVVPLVAGRTVAGIGVADGPPVLCAVRGARSAGAFAFAVSAVEPAVQVWVGFPGPAGIEVAVLVSSLAGVAVSVVAEAAALVLPLAGVWPAPAAALA